MGPVLDPSDGQPVARNLHIAFYAPHDLVDEFHGAGVEPAKSDGAPGPRPQYGEDYYGGFLRDPDGNSVEAVFTRPRPRARRDRPPVAARRRPRRDKAFYTRSARSPVSSSPRHPRHVSSSPAATSFSLHDRRAAPSTSTSRSRGDNEAVDAFHEAAIEAVYTDNGAPGERTVYHPGYYGAFVLDPDGHNIEAVNHNR